MFHHVGGSQSLYDLTSYQFSVFTSACTFYMSNLVLLLGCRLSAITDSGNSHGSNHQGLQVNLGCLEFYRRFVMQRLDISVTNDCKSL